MSKPLEILTLCVGPLEENTYLLADPDTATALIVDPGDEAERILDTLRRQRWTLEWIAITHGHVDHIGAVGPLRRCTGARVAVPARDAARLRDPILSGAQWLGLPFEPILGDLELREGDTLPAAGREWLVLETPGHTPGHINFYCAREGLLLCGDVLFAGSVGRTDLPDGSWADLARGLREKIFTLPDATRVLSGHGPETTLGHERQSNWLVQQALKGRGDPTRGGFFPDA